MTTHLTAKQIIHKLFLLISATVVLYSVAFLLISDGEFQFGGLRYYTLLSNLIVALGFIAMIFVPITQRFRSYLSFTVLVCISITGIVYNLVLVPFGWGTPITTGWANFITHLFSMVLVFINYLVFEEKGRLSFRHVIVASVPIFMYWAVSLFFGSYPYFFMSPLSVGWPMVFFWFLVFLLFTTGFAFLLVVLDKHPKLLVSSSLLLAVVICLAVIFLRPQPPIIQWSQLMENVLEQEEEVRIDFYIPKAKTYTFDSSYMLSEGIVTAFLIIDDNGDVVFHSVGEELVITSMEIELGKGHFYASWTYISSYEDLLDFFSRYGLGEVTQHENDIFFDVFRRDEVIDDSYVNIWLR